MSTTTARPTPKTARKTAPLQVPTGVAYGPGGVHVSWEEITPEMAQKMLERNDDNRSVRIEGVAQYARDLADGNWWPTGDAPRFDTDGNVLDGQHRLLAIVQAGVPMGTFVVRDVPIKSKVAIDTGMKRTAGDYLSWSGEVNGNLTAGVVRLAISLELSGGSSKTVARISNSELAQYLADNPGIRRGVRISYNTKNLLLSPTVRAYCSWKLAEIDEGASDEFFYSTASAEGFRHKDPRAALAKKMTDAKINKERHHMYTQVGMVFRAWNAWRKGEEMNFIRVASTSGGGDVPIPTPI